MDGGRVAIVGGTGVIGTELCDRLVRSGFDVRIASRKPPPVSSLDWRPLDLCGPVDQIEEAVAGVDAVIHLAARIPLDHDDPDEITRCWNVNVLGTRNLIVSLAKLGIRRLVLAGTANHYASWIDVASEDSPIHPQGRVAYLASKAAQEWMAMALCHEYGLSCAVLRIASVYGGGTGAIDRIAQRLAHGETVTLAAKGAFGADFVHVDDVAEGFRLTLRRDAEGIFNLSSGVRTDLAKVARLLVATLGVDGDLVVLRDDGSSDSGFAAVSSAKLQALGFAPTALGDGLRLLARRLGRV